MVPLYPFR